MNAYHASIERSPTPVPVVTVFLASAGQVLILKRSELVGTYRGHWAGVSGYIERLPLEQAYVELAEEAGLTGDDVRLRGIGIPVPVRDEQLSRVWMVHPFLFELDDRTRVRTDWEATESRWTHPGEIAGLPTVPGLEHALGSVWPGFGDDEFWRGLAEAATDTVHGATHIALSVLETLQAYLRRDTCAPTDRAIRAVAACRASMGVFPHIAARLSGGESPAALAELLNQATRDSAANAAGALAPFKKILTNSYSSAVRDTLLQRAGSGEPLEVVVAESRPELEGVTLAIDLAAQGIHVTVITDAQIGIFAGEVDAVLAGSDSITDDDGVQNKAGTSLMVMAARSHNVPCFAVTQTMKIVPPGFPHVIEEQDPNKVGGGDGVRFRNIIFDSTPLSMFDAVYTERGALTPNLLAEIRSRLSTAKV